MSGRLLCIGALVCILWTGSTGAAVDPPVFEQPVDCTVGLDCWIVNYPDADPGSGFTDYRCGDLGYNDHKGTDFAVRDMVAMRTGVRVRAAAAGRVVGRRDAMADRLIETSSRPDAVKGRECGNGVRIDHGAGWISQYCHLRRGSVAVKNGETIAAGQFLGFIGASGLTEFPHLHFQVSHQDNIVDPFTARRYRAGCKDPGVSMWRHDLNDSLGYQASMLSNLGITTEKPVWARVKQGAYRGRQFAAAAPALILWVEIFVVHKGDHVGFVIRDARGDAVHRTETILKKRWIRWFGFSGKQKPATDWTPGAYTGQVSLSRNRSRILVQTLDFHIR